MNNEEHRGKHIPVNPFIELELEHDRRMYEAYRKTNPEIFNPKPLPEGMGIVMIFGTGGGNDKGQDFKQIWEEAELPYKLFQSLNVWDNETNPGSEQDNEGGFFKVPTEE